MNPDPPPIAESGPANPPLRAGAGMMKAMPYGSGEVTRDLSDALGLVLGRTPETPEPIVVLAWYLDSLAKEYGLSESLDLDISPLDRVAIPAAGAAVIDHYLGGAEGRLDIDALRDRLYSVFVELSDDRDARGLINKNQPLSDIGLLHLAQIYWNLEGISSRAKLPIRPGQQIATPSGRVAADIKVPGAQKDFATMKWAARVVEKGSYKSSGQSFRRQGARLAALVAARIAAATIAPPPELKGVRLERSLDDHGQLRITAIVWPEVESPANRHFTSAPVVASGSQLALVGRPAEVGDGYQRRSSDSQIERLWADGGDRRVWLVGGPGLGKSYSARRIAQEAISSRDDTGDALVIWVDSAESTSVTTAYADAVDRLREQGVDIRSADSTEAKARALLDTLTTSNWRWLIILDNAEPGSLIEANLVPWGRNSNGRVLITTSRHDHRIRANGRVVAVDKFTPEEARNYLRADVHSRVGGHNPFLLEPTSEIEALAQTLDFHPLALSIAAATIIANATAVSDWVSEFNRASAMDAAADEPDSGGYPNLIGTTWQLALTKASNGLPQGVVERAAMVAALQSPDGHPTWLWDEEPLAAWVAGGSTAPRRGGMPAAVRRLADYGIIEFRGDSWRDGKLAIHQLAARAVRERADAESLAELAAILVDLWLLQVTGDVTLANPGDLRKNLRPVADLATASAAVRNAAQALLEFGIPASTALLARQTELVEALTPHLRRGGATGREVLAHLLTEAADMQSELGHIADAQRTYTHAAQLREELVDEPGLSEPVRAEMLAALSEVEQKLGRPEQARLHSARSAQTLERLLETEPGGDDLARLALLAELYERLGDPAKNQRLRGQVDRALQIYRRNDATRSFVPDWARADEWARLGRQLARLGRTAEAAEFLERGVDACQKVGSEWAGLLLGDLAQLHIETAAWEAAEDALTRRIASEPYPVLNQDNYVLLASVLHRLHRPKEAAATLALAGNGMDAGEVEAVDEAEEPHTGDGVSVESSNPPPEARASLADVELEMKLTNQARYLSLAVDKAKSRDRWGDALSLSRSHLEVVQRYAEDGGTERAPDLLAAHWNVGICWLHAGNAEHAIEDLKRAAAIAETLAALDPSDERQLWFAATVLEALGRALSEGGLAEEAITAFSRAASTFDLLAGRAHRPDTLGDLSDALIGLSQEYGALGRTDEALACLTRRVDLWQLATDAAPGDTTTLRWLADALMELGAGLGAADRLDDAWDPLSRAVEIREVVAARPESDLVAMSELAQSRGLVGLNYYFRGLTDEAVVWLSRSADDLTRVAEGLGDLGTQGDLALGLGRLAVALETAGRAEEASDAAARGIKILQFLVDLDPSTHCTWLMSLLRWHSEVLKRLGSNAEAADARARAEDLAKRFPDLDA